jgi:hypothetical protein
MVILTQAFVTGVDSLRNLKGIGDLEEKLRTATTVLRSDLAADHFEGKKRLSDLAFWWYGTPREGFFRIWQGTAAVAPNPFRPNDPFNPPPGTPYVWEGRDPDGNASFRATDHILHFTVKRRGNRREQFATARVPKGSPLLGLLPNLGSPDSRFQDVADTYASQWYEVAYFLRATGQTTDGTIPRFALYRRQRLIVPETTALNAPAGTSQVRYSPAALADYAEISCLRDVRNPDFLSFNSPNTIPVPQRRFGMDPTLPAGKPTVPVKGPDGQKVVGWTYPTLAEDTPALAGADLLLTDVLSFQVQGSFGEAITNAFLDLNSDFLGSHPNPNPFFARGGFHVYDTWTSLRDEWSNAPKDIWDYSTWNAGPTSQANDNVLPVAGSSIGPLPSLYAVKVTLRVWDLKTRQTRQISIIQDL